MTKIAVIRIRGQIGVRKSIKDALRFLRLHNKNYCVILPNDNNSAGMLKKVKDYITWGEMNEETLKLLLKERGRLPGNKRLDENYLKEKVKLNFDEFCKNFMEDKIKLRDVPGLKLFFRLKPPEHGFERGGIKQPFSMGGALGYRKDNINDLLRRMI